MLSELTYKKRLGFPFLSLILAYSTILISLITYFNPQYLDIFGGQGSVTYSWQYLTRYFEHGTALSYTGALSPILELLLNLLILLSLGLMCERVLGTKRYFILILGSVLVSELLGLIFSVRVSGLASIVWAFGPVSLLVLIYLFKGDRRKLIRDPLAYISLAIFPVMWLVLTVLNLLGGWHISNLVNLLASLLGLGFALLFKHYIYARLNYLLGLTSPVKDKDKVDKLISIASLGLPIFIIVVLIFCISGSLTDHVSTVNIVEIYPSSGSIEDFNRADNRVMIRFSEDMDTEKLYSHIDYKGQDEKDTIEGELVWTDEKTLEIVFNRQLKSGEYLSISLSGLRDNLDRGYYREIELEYGQETND